MDEDDWVELRRFSDPIGVDMMHDFLRDHGVRCAIRGNTKGIKMTWSASSDVLRIVVPQEEVEKAEEVLTAMTASGDHPFRGPGRREEDEAGPASEAYVKPRSPLGAAFLGLIVPIGSGHFYARHGSAGAIFLAGTIGCVLASFLGQHEFLRTWAFLVLFDMIGGFFAVRRFNQKRVPTENHQRLGAIAALVAAFVASKFVPF